MRIARADLYRYRLALRAPLALRFGTLAAREGLLLRLECADSGAVGWGEAAPLPGFSPDTLGDAEGTLRALAGVLRRAGRHPEDPVLDLDALHPGPAARFAVEAAVASADARRRGVSEADVLADAAGCAVRPRLALAGLVAADDDPGEAAARLARAGYRAAKLKVGGAPEADARAVRAFARALGDDVALRLDANRAWSYDEALRFADALGDTPVAYLEEPLAEPSGLPVLAEATGLPLALDESLVGLAPAELAGHGYARAAVLKPTVGGGLRWAAAMADEARRLGMEPVVSGAFESGVGTRALLAFAATCAPAPAGLDPYNRFAEDVLIRPLALARAEVDVLAALAHPDVQEAALTPVDVA